MRWVGMNPALPIPSRAARVQQNNCKRAPGSVRPTARQWRTPQTKCDTDISTEEGREGGIELEGVVTSECSPDNKTHPDSHPPLDSHHSRPPLFFLSPCLDGTGAARHFSSTQHISGNKPVKLAVWRVWKEREGETACGGARRAQRGIRAAPSALVWVGCACVEEGEASFN